MQIGKAEGFDPLGLPDGPTGAPKTGQPPRGVGESGDAGPASDVTAPPEYVARAAASPEINTAAVAEAKRLLESGALDTPEAARRAAEALLRLGI